MRWLPECGRWLGDSVARGGDSDQLFFHRERDAQYSRAAAISRSFREYSGDEADKSLLDPEATEVESSEDGDGVEYSLFIPPEFRGYLDLLLAITPSRQEGATLTEFAKSLDVPYDVLALFVCLRGAERKAYDRYRELEERMKIR